MRGFSPERLRALREGRGLSQGDLARMADIGRTTLYHWEIGKVSPQVDILARVAEQLGVDMSEIVVVPAAQRYPGDLRVLRGLTQPQLGQAASVSTAMIGAIERGEVEPTAAITAAIADVLEVTVDGFLEAHGRARKRPPGTPA